MTSELQIPQSSVVHVGGTKYIPRLVHVVARGHFRALVVHDSFYLYVNCCYYCEISYMY